MSPLLFEYVLKGLYLGLWAYLGLVHPGWGTVGHVLLWTVGGLGLGLVTATTLQVARGYRPGRNFAGFLLLVLLDNPFVIYVGLIGGLGLGLVIETDPPEARNWLSYCAIAGAILGYGFTQLRQVKDPFWRFGLGAAIGAILVYLAITYLGELDELKNSAEATRQLGFIILLGLPFFYLLTLCGEAEESEIEIAVFCALLGLGLYLQGFFKEVPGVGEKAVFLVPVVLYFVYATRWLPGLRVFKHVLRAYGNMSLGKVREALAGFGRALQLDRKHDLAMRGLYELHRRVDVTKLDAETVKLLNFEFCVNLAQGYLIRDRAPTESERTEALRMLDLVQTQKPDLQPRVDYLKAVALTHAKDYDRAAGYLSRLLDPTAEILKPEVRSLVLLPGWELALRQHPEIVARLGEDELKKPGRRMDAIAAVERQLEKEPDDTNAVELRRFLYSTLTEAEFLAAAGTIPPSGFNFDYVEQLGQALTEETDPERMDRGMAYLRIAGRGLPQRGPSIFRKLADLAERRNQPEEARGYLEQVKRAALLVGPSRLPPEQHAIYLQTLKKLVEDATARGDYDSAVGDQRLLIESGKEDVNTLRQLAELHAKAGDLLNAVLIVERGLLYSKADPDLLKKKDSYYFSVEVERVRDVRDKVAPWFDVNYCIAQAKKVADQKEPDLETLEWGKHLVSLARVIQPALHSGMLAEARILLRLGQRDAALTLLEDIREQKRGSGDEEDAWFLAVRLLADIYLNELNRPDLAIGCHKAFREYQKSGADSLFVLGQAYEATGDIPNAIRSFEAVTAYSQHPRYWDATEAVRRLKGIT
jgi:tetratricopeptide (TPR) repeat protein